MLSLKLFNSVLSNGDKREFVNKEALKMGLLIHPEAMYLSDTIVAYYKSQKLSGAQLNSTFHKSFHKVLNSSREELAMHQIIHYLTTYGFQALGVYSDDTVYIPNEPLDIPEITEQVNLKVIKALTRPEMIEKCIDLMASGIALKQETITDVLALLAELNHTVTGTDLARIKNREAKLILIDRMGVMPTDGAEFVRYIVWKATGSTLLIKDRATLDAIKMSRYNLVDAAAKAGLISIAKVFNRFKPIFLAFKAANPANKATINRISKLSKLYHEPMQQDVLSTITSGFHSEDTIRRALSKATNFRKISILYALHNRLVGTDNMMYRVRNGKSFVKPAKDLNTGTLIRLRDIVYNSLMSSLDVNGKVIKLTEGVDYALPTSEKKFIGNLPEGTSVNMDSDLVAGIYWENSGGASDLDLSLLSLQKIGWNSRYKNQSKTAVYSGDLTNASSGAAEVYGVKNGLSTPQLMVNNVYSGSHDAKFKVFVAHDPEMERGDYTVDPNKVIFEAHTEMPSTRQAIVGMFVPQMDGSTSFALINSGFGNLRVSGVSQNTIAAREFLFKTLANPIKFADVLRDAGATVVTKNDDAYEVDIDLTVENLEKDSIINVIK